MTIDEIRSQFPYLETGLIYLNHAATAPMSNYVESNVREYMEVAHKGHVENFANLLHTFVETRQLAAEWIGTTEDRIAFIQNTSTGLNVLASGIPWEPGDRILLAEGEFPANIYPFLNQRRHGVEIDFVAQNNGRIKLGDIEQAITPRTRLLSLSWVQYLSGYTLDLKALYHLCRSKGVLLCIDAIQGIGARRLNLKETPVDFMSSGVQKWQMGMHGMGVMYVSEAVQDLIEQAHLGWFSVKDFFDFTSYDHPLQDTAERYECGTFNTAGIYAYNGALKLFRDAGFDEVERLVRSNSDRVFNIAQACNYEILSPETATERSGIVTFKVNDAEAVEAALIENGVTVSARVGHIRVSPHFYNTFDEIDRAMDIIAETLQSQVR
jgi:selenocysteine lyase/cysteine desulfurase